eukprot:578282-Alexandrium_andersonii.AAC.1
MAGGRCAKHCWARYLCLVHRRGWTAAERPGCPPRRPKQSFQKLRAGLAGGHHGSKGLAGPAAAPRPGLRHATLGRARQAEWTASPRAAADRRRNGRAD